MSISKDTIVEKYTEFAKFLSSVDINELRSHYSRQELKELVNDLRKIDVRLLPYEIGKVVDEMKKEEYPELLGVHHFPALREIDFMSEDKKIELDDYLVSMRKGNFIQTLWRFCQDTEKLLHFLEEKGIVEKVYIITCPHHPSEWLTTKLTLPEFERIKKIIETQDMDELDKLMDREVATYCDECERNLELTEWKDSMKREEYLLAQSRDTSLDNV